MATATETAYTPRLKELYRDNLCGRLKDELDLGTVMQVPRVAKVTLNMGVGEAKTEAKALDSAIEELTLIAGQRAQVRRARKSIAGFKIREGMPIGARVREQIIFPEIDYDEISSIRGLDVAVTTTASTDEQGLALLRGLGFPFAGQPRDGQE